MRTAADMPELPTRWTPGTTVVRRDMWRGKPLYTSAAIVVEDSPDRLVLFSPDGSQSSIAASAEIIEEMARGSWTMRPHARYNHTLGLYEPGAAHCVALFWTVEWDFIGWYVNLEEPYRRTSIGIDTCDLALDIVVAPDFSWHWKDEDDFAEWQERGLISAARAAEIRAEGERVIERIESRSRPFDEPWPEWRPDESWPVPMLPEGWAEA